MVQREKESERERLSERNGVLFSATAQNERHPVCGKIYGAVFRFRREKQK